MDEPFSALDPLTREALQDEVKNLQQKLNKTIVFVSHDMSEALKLADIIIFMSAGEIVQMASPEEMLEHPATDLVRTFMGKHTPETAPSKVESFMRTNVFSVHKDRGVLECAERMARGSVDTLLVTDDQNRYMGHHLHRRHPPLGAGAGQHRAPDPPDRPDRPGRRRGQGELDYLLDSGANYVVVLNADDTIAGIVTKTSVARSVAENLWGESQMSGFFDTIRELMADYGAELLTAIGVHTVFVVVSVAIGFAAGLVLGILLSRVPPVALRASSSRCSPSSRPSPAWCSSACCSSGGAASTPRSSRR